MRVNGAVARAANLKLVKGDVVDLGEPMGQGPRRVQPGLDVVYEDEDVIVVDKGCGLLTVATAKERERTAYAFLSEHVKRTSPRSRVFVVHRIDRPASGLLVFAKTLEAKTHLMAQFRTHTVERRYVAVVVGRLDPEEGEIRSRLVEDQVTGRVREAHAGVRVARPCVTHYRVLRGGERWSTVELRLETGHKHQIRVHLAAKGHPIAGEPDYGEGDVADPIGRLALHAKSIAFRHPRTGEVVRFASAVPMRMRKLRG